MRLQLRAEERTALVAAAERETQVRHWRRYRAVLLLAEHAPEQVATLLACSRSSVYAWAVAYRDHGLAGLAEPPRRGRPRSLDAAAVALLEQRLGEDPQTRGQHATGWTVPLLRADLAQTGPPVSARTIRRTLHRQGWRWKRPKYVLGRPDPDYAEKKTP